MTPEFAKMFTKGELAAVRVGFITANEGVEQIELVAPWQALTSAGAACELIAPEPGRVQGFNHLDKGDTFTVDRRSAEASVDSYDVLVMPGGVANPDQLRLDEASVSFVRSFVQSGKLVAAICHAPWTLIEADVVAGRRLTSWPSLRTDIANAGGDWSDNEVVIDGALITSRKPDDLEAFCRAIVDEVAKEKVA
ncbi:MAG: type 1 glutamine amidotransferase domain-containing protein [Acidimicrobiales bacterium]